jgi:ribosomal-protein-alanine N-acetyltransferase
MRMLQGPRVVLEPQLAAHADEMFAVLGDPAIYTVENAPPASLEWLRERYARLESRRSPDGSEIWLNWVVRLRSAPVLAGYVQATVRPDARAAALAYEFASAYWGRGLARESTEAVIRELGVHYGVTRLTAVAKQANRRSLALLQRLGFALAACGPGEGSEIGADEVFASRTLDR